MFEKTFEVVVLRYEATGPDRLGNPVMGTPTPETVADVLIQSPTTADLEAARPLGASLAFTLHFPATYGASLRGCKVVLPEPYAGTYKVVGDPKPDPNAPMRFANRWNRAVHVEYADG